MKKAVNQSGKTRSLHSLCSVLCVIWAWTVVLGMKHPLYSNCREHQEQGSLVVPYPWVSLVQKASMAFASLGNSGKHPLPPSLQAAGCFALHHCPVRAQGFSCPPSFAHCPLEGATSAGWWFQRCFSCSLENNYEGLGKPGFLCRKQDRYRGEGRLGSTAMSCCLALLCLQFWSLITNHFTPCSANLQHGFIFPSLAPDWLDWHLFTRGRWWQGWKSNCSAEVGGILLQEDAHWAVSFMGKADETFLFPKIGLWKAFTRWSSPHISVLHTIDTVPVHFL